MAVPLLLDGCDYVTGGAAFSVSDTKSFTFNGSVDTAYYTNGSLDQSNPAGVFALTRVASSNINASVNGDGCWYRSNSMAIN